jgi:Predicted membrane protein (DUF2254)
MNAFAGMTRRMRVRRAASRVWDSLWFVPAVYVLVALGLSVGLVRWDQADPIVLARSFNASSAASALSALGSGMIAFTGFVTSVVLLLVQFGTSEFSARFVAWFRRDRTLIFALSTFSATFVFALVSTAQTGRGTAAFVPSRTLIAALLLTLLSILMFLLLIDRTSDGLRVAHVVQVLDGQARKVFDAAHPASASGAATAQQTARSLYGLTPVQTVSLGAVGQVVVALDRTAIADLAARYDAVIQLVPAISDQLDQAQDDEQHDDDHDDRQHGGLGQEDEYQRGEGHCPDPERRAVPVRPVGGRAGGQAPALAEVPDPVRARRQRRAGLDRGAGGPGEVRRDGDDQPDRQDHAEPCPEEMHQRVERGGGGIGGQRAAGDAAEVDATADPQADAQDKHGRGHAEGRSHQRPAPAPRDPHPGGE